MNPSLTINAEDGTMQIEGCTTVIRAGLSSGDVLSALLQFHQRNIDHKNGYTWFSFHGLSFGGQPCGISMCFHFDRLTEGHWGVSLPYAEQEGGWPTRKAIDEEIEFVREVLSKALFGSFSSGKERFTWGEVWSMFDPKGFLASSGLRYAA